MKSHCLASLALGVLGLSFFSWQFGIALLNPAWVEWLVSPTAWPTFSDHTIHQLGWMFYQQAPWGFPLGQAPGYMDPLPIRVAYTDSIPWLATVWKLLGPAKGTPTQYLGWWVAACYILQPVAGYVLALQLGARRLMTCGLAGVICLFAPTLNKRIFSGGSFGHVVLGAQSLILLAMSWSLAAERRGGAMTAAGAAVAFGLVGLAAATHPYLAAMVLCFVLAQWVGRPPYTQSSFLSLGLLGWLIAILTLFGYFPATFARGAGSHYFAADMLTWLNPMGYPAWLPTLPFGGGQVEGFAYLGLGTVGSLVWAWWARALSLRDGFARAPRFSIALGVLTVYAWSAQVRFAGAWLISLAPLYAIVGGLTDAFRSSGRMIWPATYLLTVWAVVWLEKKWRQTQQKTRIALGAVLLVGVQMLDSAVFWPQARAQLARVGLNPGKDSGTELVAWSAVSRLAFIPPQLGGCTCEGLGAQGLAMLPWMRHAANLQIPVNSGFVANLPPEQCWSQCQGEMQRYRSGPEAGTLYVFHPKWWNHHPQEHSRFGDPCVQVPSWVFCQTDGPSRAN